MGRDFFSRVNEHEGENNEALLTTRVRNAVSGKKAEGEEKVEGKKAGSKLEIEKEADIVVKKRKNHAPSNIPKIEIKISEDKSNEKIVVVRVRNKENELFKELKYKYRKGAHEFFHKIINSIDTKVINKTMLYDLEDDDRPITNMRVLEEDYELIRKICYKKGLTQHEVIAIMCAMVEFK